MALSRAFLWMAIGSLAGLVALWLVLAFSPVWVSGAERIMIALGIAVAYGVGGSACAAGRQRGKHARLMMSGIIAGGLAATGWMAALIVYDLTDQFPARVLWALLAPSGWLVLMMYLAALSGANVRRRWVVWTMRAAMLVASLLVASTVLFVGLYVEFEQRDVRYGLRREVAELGWKIGGVLGVLTSLSMLIVALAALLPRLEHEGTPESERLRVRLTCPRCGTGQTIRSDGDACARCRLRIKVTPT
jgi:hypothetical protein